MNLKFQTNPNYHLLLDLDAPVKEGQYFYNTYTNELQRCVFVNGKYIEVNDSKSRAGITSNDASICKSIYTHIPLNGSPLLEGVLLMQQEDDVERMAEKLFPIASVKMLDSNEIFDINTRSRSIWIAGYKVAQQDKKWSDEDMRKCWEAKSDYFTMVSTIQPETFDDYIVSISPQPIDFIVEMQEMTTVDDYPKTHLEPIIKGNILQGKLKYK